MKSIHTCHSKCPAGVKQQKDLSAAAAGRGQQRTLEQKDLMPDGCARVTPSPVITGLHTKQSQTLPTYCILLMTLNFSVMEPLYNYLSA
jgi:hypothetical protein